MIFLYLTVPCEKKHKNGFKNILFFWFTIYQSTVLLSEKVIYSGITILKFQSGTYQDLSNQKYLYLETVTFISKST